MFHFRPPVAKPKSRPDAPLAGQRLFALQRHRGVVIAAMMVGRPHLLGERPRPRLVARSNPPKTFEPGRRQLGAAHRVLDVLAASQARSNKFRGPRRLRLLPRISEAAMAHTRSAPRA